MEDLEENSNLTGYVIGTLFIFLFVWLAYIATKKNSEFYFSNFYPGVIKTTDQALRNDRVGSISIIYHTEITLESGEIVILNNVSHKFKIGTNVCVAKQRSFKNGNYIRYLIVPNSKCV